MGRRVPPTDVLGEVRRALRVLRRVERWLVQCARDEKRRGQKATERDKRAKNSEGLDDGAPL